MFVVAKLLQAGGLAYCGYALFVGLTEPNAMGKELQLLLIAIGVFVAGWLLERKAAA